MTNRARSLGALFLGASRNYANRLALDVGGRAITYRELAVKAGRIAAVVAQGADKQKHLGSVFASRSETAYAGILGTLLAGAGYVPLNPKFPIHRNAHMLSTSGSRTLVVGSECAAQLPALLAATAISPLAIVCPDVDDPTSLAESHPSHRFIGARELAGYEPIDATPLVDDDDIAYLLFTSGSTGAPKGVMVSHANVLSFLDSVWARYKITTEDRFSQMFDLTFDLSAFDLFACLGRGASLHCVPSEALMVPDEFIRSHALTVWFSVPSVGMMLRKLRRLTPNAFPSLRLGLFCGERLPAVVAGDWQTAAPNAVIENLYGPTEVTIACTVYRWADGSALECVDGVVPIGKPNSGLSAALVDEQLVAVPSGQKGEICMKGPQVALGYWKDVEKTEERFVEMSWDSEADNRWYRTGDLAYVDANGNLIHIGRNDDQVKLRGFRIELPEVEHAVREAAGTSFAVVLPYPSTPEGLQGLTAVVVRADVGEDEILDRVRRTLPDYMVPGSVVFVAELPLNTNGKIDKPALLAFLREADA